MKIKFNHKPDLRCVQKYFGAVLVLLLATASLTVCAADSAVSISIPVMSWDELQSMPLPDAAPHIAYGKDPLQFGELRLPKSAQGRPSFPVVILIHGGCWLSDFDDIYMTRLAAALAQSGIASWTIEYRRIGDGGGGWPGTFLDVAHAADFLRELAPKYSLDLHRVVALGHSSGGQLALWLAARSRLPHDSTLYLPAPLKIHGVIGLAAVTDFATYRIGAEGSCNAAVDTLLAGSPTSQPRRYAETSPMSLLPLGVPQWLIQGERDHIVSPDSATRYAVAARAKGDRITLLPVSGAGHFDLVAPDSPTGAWKIWQTAVMQSLGRSPPP